MAEHYRIRFRDGDFEIEVEGTDLKRVRSAVKRYLDDNWGAELKRDGGSADSVGARGGRGMSLREFYKKVSPSQKQQEVATIAYYMEHFEEPSVLNWKPKDVNSRWSKTRSKQKPQNLSGTISQSDFFMRSDERGTWKLSNTGLEWVQERLESDEE